MRESKTEIRNRWESAAPGWVKWEHVQSRGFRDATEAMLDMARIRSGMDVLDVACGAGSTSLQAAERVGPTGRVVASDISATMLEHLRRRASSHGFGNIETLECAADEISVGSDRFDSAICRLGLMLFPEPVKSGAAIRNTLKPGGRFAPLVFTTPPNNPFLSVPMQILLRHASKEPPPPGGPGIFALGAPGILKATLEKSGYTEVTSEVVPVKLTLGSASEALEMMQVAYGNYRTVVADLSEDAKEAAWSEVGEFLQHFETDNEWQVDLEIVIGSGMA